MGLFKNKRNNFSKSDQLQFFDVVASYINAGISPTEAVPLYRQSLADDTYAYKVAGNIIRDMQNGLDFAEAIGKHPQEFPAFTIGMLEVAQNTGTLPVVLEEIVTHLEREIDIQHKISSATLVPKISAVGVGIVFFFITTYVIPKLGAILIDMKVELPTITAVVLYIGEFMQSFWWLILLGLGGLYLVNKAVKAKHPDKYEFTIMQLPFWRGIAFNQLRYNFCTIMGLCTNAGIRPAQALEYTATAIDNGYMRQAILKAVAHIANGTEIDKAIKREDTHNLLDSDLYTMLKTGAGTGNLGAIMTKQSKSYRKKLDTAAGKIGDQVGITVLVPSYIVLVVLLAAIEYPIITLATNFGG